MKRLGIIVLLATGCTFDPGGGGLPIGGGDCDGDCTDAHVFDDGGPPDLLDVPDLHSVPDGIVPGSLGWPCASAGECDNGFCIDGYCCESDCNRDTNLCKACNLPGQEGHCVFALDGTDPRQQCDQDPTSSCGQDGLCDGKGACRKWNAGTACGADSCTNGSVQYAPACDGKGNCVDGNVATCYPYDCLDTTKCATTCSPSMNTCATGVPCTNSICGKRSDGQPCNTTSDCQSGHCEQGVCCASACTGTCFACNLPGKQGTCAAVPAGIDPLNQCAATTRASCGLDGSCDGSGACRKWVSGTPCAGTTCMGDNSLGPRSCDGNGTCQPAAMTTSCGKYACNAANGTCYTNCLSDIQCSMSRKCNTGKQQCK
jgi:hypothetical protein